MSMTTCPFRREHRLVLCLAGVILSLLSVAAPSFGTMPAPPLDVALDLGGPAAVDVAVTVTLKARPLVNADRMSLSITLPRGVDLVAGETTWKGAAAAGQLQTLTVTITPREATTAVIQGTALLEFADGATLGDMRSLTLQLDPASTLKPSLPPSKKTQKGEPVIEYGP